MKNQFRNTILALFCLLPLFSAVPVFAAPARVAILPFDINAEKDLTFLQEGILDMLGSRLAWQDNVEIINKKETKAALASIEGFEGESRALLVGGKLQADYVLFGSLTVFGESVSIDAKMADVSGQQAPLPFFVQTRSMGEVIPQINQFATDINATVFNRSVAQRPTTAPAPQAGVASAPQAQPQPAQEAYDPRMHPEKLLQSGIPSETQAPVAGPTYQAPNPAFVANAHVRSDASERTYWKSRNFKTLINGIEIADVDNDGRQEIILATERVLSIYRVENGRMIKVSDTAEAGNSSYVGVDVADINGNGTPEIYVSSLGPNRSSVNSFVLEFDGSQFKTIRENDNWFYRVARPVDRGALLMGQRMRTAEESVFNNPIYELQWQSDRLEPGNQLLKGRVANLMGVAYGDVTHTGQSEIIAYSREDRLRLYNPGGEDVWEESERSGGNMIFFKPPRSDPGVENKQFLPLRIRLTDIDRDGKTEVLVARHDELTRNLAKDFRSFSNGRLESRVWDGLTLVTQWKTQEFSGRASDFVVGDYDNDGADELVVAVVVKEGAVIFTDAVSNIIAFDLNPQ
ncbi:MAG: VCBS repeat-containing protein [Desulfosarcina sp.]